ncbi:hypothetical protein ACJX0J_030866, partial [Zea mays]
LFSVSGFTADGRSHTDHILGRTYQCPMANIIRKCWDPNLDKRPDMDEVVRLLEALDTRKRGGMTPKGQAGGQGGNLLIDLFRHCDNPLGEKQVNNPFFHKTPSGSARQPLQLTNDVTKMMQKHQLETPQFHQTRFSVLLNVPRSIEKFYFHVVAGIHLRDVSFLIPHSWLLAMLDDQMSFPSLRQTRTTGCFRLHPIRDEDAKFKLCNGRSVQFDVGNVVMVTGGRNIGHVGVIKNWEKHKGIFEVIDVLLGAFCMLCLVFSYLLY